MKTRFKKLIAIVCAFFLHPMLVPGSLAQARGRKALRAYSFIVEAGKASQGVCDGETAIPRHLKRLHEMAKASSYLGSELMNPESQGKPESEMWKHYFRAKASCNVVLEKTPSAIKNDTLETIKKDLPADDSADDDDSDQSDSQGTPDAE